MSDTPSSGTEQGSNHWWTVDSGDGEVVLRIGAGDVSVSLPQSPERARNLADKLERKACNVQAGTDHEEDSQ